MSRLNDLIRQVAHQDGKLAADLRREFDALADRRAFGLNFERHTPEAVELPGRPVRKNDKVRILPERGQMPKTADERLFKVITTYPEGGERWADVEALDDPNESWSVVVDDLVVVAEFRDPIYPGLVSTGKVERGGDKPFHTVINAENYHALQSLLYTHRGAVDAIYIDPPYNTGAKDWKYNNDYVESEDHYRHSKWLAMMERRLLLARELLDPARSVLIVTIDEKEYLRLGLLLDQVFPDAKIQMVTSIINPAGSPRANGFSRSEEFLFFVALGDSAPARTEYDMSSDEPSAVATPDMWSRLQRGGTGARRVDSKNLFYPIFVDRGARKIVEIGDPLPLSQPRSSVVVPEGLTAIWPLRKDGSEGRWRVSHTSLRGLVENGFVRLGKDGTSLSYLLSSAVARIETGELVVTGHVDGTVVLEAGQDAKRAVPPKSVWFRRSHDASKGGSYLLRSLIPDRKFPFPKSVFAVEDALRFFVGDNVEATVVDFFSGSGTTAHAVMRLNRQDGGRRRSISVTNNEVSIDEQGKLRKEGYRPGDPEWEMWGICDYITKPRIEAAVSGQTPDGEPIRGDYKFTDEFPMAEGFEENVEFFTLTYESALRVASNREFSKVAPFLWLRAGSRGRRIDEITSGWDVAEAYGVIANLDLSEQFVKAVEAQDGLTHAFIVTDEDRLFEAMVRQLPAHIEPVRLYSSYLRNFEIEAARAAR
ncbi:DNA methyltransferase [Aeromicrobium sp. NPDC092404]|uniref:site-specific DNA-methyltransferase n=1 Tax=Aeromicrobium sp. NPDC092404 TaxID=3154976 RepID=UPI003428B635